MGPGRAPETLDDEADEALGGADPVGVAVACDSTTDAITPNSNIASQRPAPPVVRGVLSNAATPPSQPECRLPDAECRERDASPAPSRSFPLPDRPLLPLPELFKRAVRRLHTLPPPTTRAQQRELADATRLHNRFFPDDPLPIPIHIPIPPGTPPPPPPHSTGPPRAAA